MPNAIRLHRRPIGRMLWALGLAWASVAPALAAAPAGPHLVDEQRVFPADDQGWKFNDRSYWPQMRLSPDGGRLLYARGDGEQVRLVLRDLTTGEDLAVPIPATKGRIAEFYPLINSFDQAGERMVLNIFDADSKQPRSSISIWKIGDAQATDTGIAGPMILGQFDHSGKALVVLNGRQLGLASEPDYEVKPLETIAMNWSCSPKADLLCVARPRRGKVANGEPAADLVLFEVAANAVTDSIPVQNGRELDDLQSQWTADGRYIYFPDVGTMLWDRELKKEPVRLSTGYPIGPGPTPSTMLIRLMPSRAGALATQIPVDEHAKILLHDAASGKGWTLGDEDCELQAARAGRIVYLRRTGDGVVSVHTARVAME